MGCWSCSHYSQPFHEISEWLDRSNYMEKNTKNSGKNRPIRHYGRIFAQGHSRLPHQVYDYSVVHWYLFTGEQIESYYGSVSYADGIQKIADGPPAREVSTTFLRTPNDGKARNSKVYTALFPHFGEFRRLSRDSTGGKHIVILKQGSVSAEKC